MIQKINIQKLRNKFLKFHHISHLEQFYDSEEEKIDTIIQNLTEKNEDSLVADIQLSQCGFYCAVTLRIINELLIFITSTTTTASSKNKLLVQNTSLVSSTIYIPVWEIYKIIKINNDFPLARTTFIMPWLPPYSQFRKTSVDSKFVLCHSKDENLSIINVESLGKYNFVSNAMSRNCHKYAVSPNGKMLSIISSKDGQITIFSVNCLLEKINAKDRQNDYFLKQLHEEADNVAYPDKFQNKINVVKKRLECIHKEVRMA